MESTESEGYAGAQPGDILAGKYRVEKVLGVGGMGLVVSAVHLELEQRVAIKWMHTALAGNQELVARFLREGKAAARLSSEHVARVLDVGRFEGGEPYMVMEYLEGGDLSQEIETKGQLPIPIAVDYMMQALEAVAEAHAHGIVHRDLKPSNLFLTRRPDGSPLVKVLDFGISKLSEEGGNKNMTSTKAMLGSPSYMSPEQIRSAKHVDQRCDVWAFGVILYELLAACPPFDAESLPGLIASISMDPPVPLRSKRPDVPEQLEAVVLHCLEKNVDRRFQDVAELAYALVPFGSASAAEAAPRVARVLGKQMAGPQGAEVATRGATMMVSPAVNTGVAAGNPHGMTQDSFGVTLPRNHMDRRILVVAGIGGVVVAVALVAWILLKGPFSSVEAVASGGPSASTTASEVPTVAATTSKPSETASSGVDAGADSAPPADAGSTPTVKPKSAAIKPRVTKHLWGGKKRPHASKKPVSTHTPAKPKPPTKSGGGIDLTERK